MPKMTPENVRRVLAGQRALEDDDQPSNGQNWPKQPKRTGGKGDGWRQLTAFKDATLRNLNRSQFAVWFVLFVRADRATSIVKVSVRTIATEAGCVASPCWLPCGC